MNGRLTKIKVKDGTWFFAWETFKEKLKRWDSYTFESDDAPLPELRERLQAMAIHVAEICEIKDWKKEMITVDGVSIKTKDDNKYVCVSAKKVLLNSKAPLIINTPVRPAEVGDGYAQAQCMSVSMIEDLERLEEEAWRYINGERAQQKLEFGEPEKEKPEDGEKPEQVD